MSDKDILNPLLLGREEINPYRKAVGIILERMKWDINFEAWRSRNNLRGLKDKYKNKKAVILCNGPSLLDVDFKLLDDVFTFGLNKINLIFDKTKFRPSCIVSVNKLVIEQNFEFYRSTEIPLFLDSYANKFITSKDGVSFLHSTAFHGFAKDCSWSVYQSHTVTYVAMQLAFHMGFKDVALVGCDHSFAVQGHANKTEIAEGKDKSHFDPNYFSNGMKWHLPDLFESEVGYFRAKRVYEAYGRKIINATSGGKLDIFDRVELSDFLND